MLPTYRLGGNVQYAGLALQLSRVEVGEVEWEAGVAQVLPGTYEMGAGAGYLL